MDKVKRLPDFIQGENKGYEICESKIIEGAGLCLYLATNMFPPAFLDPKNEDQIYYNADAIIQELAPVIFYYNEDTNTIRPLRVEHSHLKVSDFKYLIKDTDFK